MSPPIELDRATFMDAITSLRRRAFDGDQDALDTLKAIVYYVGRLEQAIDAGVGWDHV